MRTGGNCSWHIHTNTFCGLRRFHPPPPNRKLRRVLISPERQPTYAQYRYSAGARNKLLRRYRTSERIVGSRKMPDLSRHQKAHGISIGGTPVLPDYEFAQLSCI